MSGPFEHPRLGITICWICRMEEHAMMDVLIWADTGCAIVDVWTHRRVSSRVRSEVVDLSKPNPPYNVTGGYRR
jgi:hypothetical protein